jgi:hypothetical protein
LGSRKQQVSDLKARCQFVLVANLWPNSFRLVRLTFSYSARYIA